MKKISLLTILILTSVSGFAQVLTEITNISLFEHHFSGCTPCEPANFGDSSAYDFVTHQHINAIFPLLYDVNRDMVEHNGDPQGPAPFGFTSDSSSVGGGAFGGNGTTVYHLVSGFDYANATQASVINAYNNSIASTDVEVVQIGEVYIGKIRNLDYYIVMIITDYQSITDNDFTFDYKYTDNPIATNAISEIDQVASFDVYPNPTSGSMSVDFREQKYAEVEIEVLNSVGQVIQKSKYYDTDMCELQIIDEAGIYFVKVTSNNSTSTVKVLKQN